MINRRLEKRRKQGGFTIIELMIATAVLSTILVTVTVVMISIGNLYYKGVNQARIQDSTRSVIDELAQRLELNGQPVNVSTQQTVGGVNINAYCVGTTRYTYAIGVRIGDHGLSHVLWRDTIQSSDNCLNAKLVTGNPSLLSDVGNTNAKDGTELIAPNSRLIDFTINPYATSPYGLRIGMAYGEDDVLCSPSVAGSCVSDDTVMSSIADYSHRDLHCKGRSSSRFCSTAVLTSTVVPRLTSH